ncbi:MAG: DNA translocase FtsK 4TM domain-containing protein, partial [Pirellulaceae bacterium]
MFDNRNPRCDLLAVVLIVLTLFLTVSVLTYQPADPVGKMFPPLDKFYQADVLVWPQNVEIQNACGHWGAIVADLLFTTLGIGAFFLIIGIGAVAIALLQNQQLSAMWSRTAGWLLSLVGMTTVATMLLPQATLGPIIGPGGYIGALGNGLLQMHFAGVGGLMVAISVLAIGMFLWTEYVFLKVLGLGLIGLATVFSFLLPTGTLGRIRERFQLGADEDDEYEDDEDEDTGTTVRRRSIYADDPEEDEEEEEDEAAAEYEEDEEEDEAWYEDDLDEEPGTIPFVQKTAAKQTAVLD